MGTCTPEVWTFAFFFSSSLLASLTDDLKQYVDANGTIAWSDHRSLQIRMQLIKYTLLFCPYRLVKNDTNNRLELPRGQKSRAKIIIGKLLGKRCGIGDMSISKVTTGIDNSLTKAAEEIKQFQDSPGAGGHIHGQQYFFCY